MNNDQFRRLVLDQPGKKRADKASPNRESTPTSTSTPSAAILGSHFRSSIPMTPRNVKGGTADFARQLAEHRREELQQQRPTKRFKSSAAPKGTRLASGYQDRTALRREQDDGSQIDDKNKETESVAQRLKALEDMLKLGQIDNAMFEKLRKEIGVGGDLDSTHMVKGLDWDLLRRVKAGEDVSKKQQQEKEEEAEVEAGDVDEELDRMLEEKEGQMAPPPPKEKKVKKGNLATAPAGKMSRDEILRQLKASRAAAAAAAPQSTLSAKFKKIKDDIPEKKRWIETDPNGRRKEILVITDAEGKTKRKVRWLDKEDKTAVSKVDGNGLLLLSQDAKPLGMEVPAVVAAKIAAEAAAAAQAEAEDDDIFAGVGTDYNPLAGLDENDSDEEGGDEEKEEKLLENKPSKEEPSTAPPDYQPAPRRNYFNDKKTAEDAADTSRSNALTQDPTLLAALKRAAALRQASSKDVEGDGEEGELVDDATEDPEKLARRKKFLEEARRRDAQDALDLDYGFGSSRVEDEEDEEGPTFDAAGQRGGSNKRKRGPKKRKGDKDSAADVLRVMEGRKNK